MSFPQPIEKSVSPGCCFSDIQLIDIKVLLKTTCVCLLSVREFLKSYFLNLILFEKSCLRNFQGDLGS
jgi:hypothetical protein